jgi:hypothetical protein
MASEGNGTPHPGDGGLGERVSAVQPPHRGFQASAWGWAAVVATVASAFGYALQTILDLVPAPPTFAFAEFWGLFAGDAVIAFLTGIVAVVTGWRSRRRDATIAFGLIGIGWLLLAQAIQSLWD